MMRNVLNNHAHTLGSGTDRNSAKEKELPRRCRGIFIQISKEESKSIARDVELRRLRKRQSCLAVLFLPKFY